MPKVQDEGSPDVIFEPLLDYECGAAFMGQPGITTATFFSLPTDEDVSMAIRSLQNRVLAIAQQNPWLVARLVKDKARHKNVMMTFPKIPTMQDVQHIFEVSTSTTLTALTGKDPIDHTLRVLSGTSAVVIQAKQLIGKPLGHIAKFTAVACADGKKLMLIVSISHAVSDGHTYYNILQMLSADSPILIMNPTRKHDKWNELKRAPGDKEYAFQVKPSLTMNIIGSIMFHAKSTFHAFVVDEEKIKEAKARVEPGKFVSTNDVLTSTFGKGSKARVLLMAINWRGRVRGVDKLDAGNYETCVLHDPESYETPSLIRECITGELPLVRPSDRALPACWESVRCKLAMITSWDFSDFTCDLKILPGVDTPVVLHVPINKPEGMPFDICVVFKARKNTKAVMYFCKGTTVDELKAAGAPIGAELS